MSNSRLSKHGQVASVQDTFTAAQSQTGPPTGRTELF